MQLTLAPQLRQSLELLQVPLLELRTLVQQEMEQNPTLEDQPLEADHLEVEQGTSDVEKAVDDEIDDEFDKLIQLDDEWRDYFSQQAGSGRRSREDEEKRQYFLDSLSQPESLQQHLMDQLALAELEDEDQQIGELIIGSIDDDGYLMTPAEDLAATTGYDPVRVREILAMIQEFDPIGVGASDLKECLMLQLNRLGHIDTLPVKIVETHLKELGARKYQDIARAMKTGMDDIEAAARFISTLEPKPGRRFSSEATSYVIPEVIVQEIKGEYVVTLTNEQLPHLHISNHYRKLMEDESTTAEVKSYIREKVRNGMFLIKSINQRQQTIFNIATEIVLVQKDFLEHGVTQLRPLTMAQVAEKVGIHETTVSRAIANKYMQTPRGTYEMKYFFTPGYKTEDGQSVSNQTIKDAIQQLVEAEDPAHPLSDQAIVGKLKEKGYKVARRTVAKYRDALKILPSHLRKGF